MTWRYLFDLGILERQPGPGDSWFLIFRCICVGVNHGLFHVRRVAQQWEVLTDDAA